jgi:hypothetical protein
VNCIKYAANFDLLKSASSNPKHLYHVVLRGEDGSECHCVAVYNNYIFDGNFFHAWKLTHDNLSECIDSKYENIARGNMYVLIKNDR